MARAAVSLPEASQSEPIWASADAANRWQQGSYEVWVLRGHCRIVQGTSVAQCGEAVLWIDRAGAGDAYVKQLAGPAPEAPPPQAPGSP